MTGLHRSRKPVPGLSLLRKPFPFKRAKVVYTQGGGGRSSLPASRHPPRRLGRVREGKSPHSTVDLRETDRRTLGRRVGQPRGS